MAKRTSKKKPQGQNKTSKKKSRNSARTSFKRTYREDYLRELEVPGMGQHIFQAFKMIFLNWKIFLPLILIMTLVTIGVVGFLNYSSFKDVAVMVVMAIIILSLFLMTIFVIRHRMAGHKVSIRDTFYNAMTPLYSSLVVLAILTIQAVPVMILAVAYSSAIETHFLDAPFYALLFLVFAGLMILLTAYLWSGTLIAFVAVSAPGMYPFEAIKTANELMRGRRIRFTLRIIALLIVLFVIFAITIWPLAVFLPESPITSIILTIVGCFMIIYTASYLYIYYRYMLDYDSSVES